MTTRTANRRPRCLDVNEGDVRMLMNAGSHIGSKVATKGMKPYSLGLRADGAHAINLWCTYEKLLIAARVIAAIKNPKDVCFVATRTYGHRALHKMAEYLGVNVCVGRFMPGSFTNHIMSYFKEPRLVVAMDPLADHQAIKESSQANIPVLALCNMDSPLKNIDIVIPANNRARISCGLVYYLLTREILKLRGIIPGPEWNVLPDMFIYRDTESGDESEYLEDEAVEEFPDLENDDEENRWTQEKKESELRDDSDQ